MRNSRAPGKSRSAIASTRRTSPSGCPRMSRALQGPLTVRQFKGGQSNPTYRLITPGRTYVLRRKPPGKLLPSAHAVDREYRVITALGKRRVSRSPRLRPVHRRRRDRHRFYIMDMVEGRIFWDQTLPSQPPERGERSSPARSRRSATCTTPIRRRSASATSASPATTSRARSTAGPSSTRPPRPQHIPEMERLIEWLPQDPAAAGARPRSSTATTGSTT